MSRIIAFAFLGLLPACSFMTEDDAYYAGGSEGGKTPPALGCDPLAPPAGNVVTVTASQAGALPALVSGAASGTTLSLEPGTYVISEPLVFSMPDVTLRSTTDDSASVTIDGQRNTDLIRVNASNVTIAHVTVTRASEIAVLVQPGAASGFRLHGARIIDGGQEFLRAEGSAVGYVDQASITCTDFQLTGELRADVCCPGCVLIGLNVFGGRDWVLRGSRFSELNCAGSVDPAPFAAVFRGGVRDALIENNSFWNPERGLALGFQAGTEPPRAYPDAPYAGAALEFIDGIARNNVIFSDQSWFDTGMEINHAREPLVLHNTIVHTSPNAYRSIDWRYADTHAIVSNNLVTAMGPRDDGTAATTTNLENTPLEYFVDPSNFDLHLVAGATGAIDRATASPDSGVDLDGQPHGTLPDIGADER